MTLNWTNKKPEGEGLYLYREEVNPAIDQRDLSHVYTGCVLMKVHFWKDGQMGIARHLCAEPLLTWDGTKPGFVVSRMNGEWAAWDSANARMNEEASYEE
jgi:hypothetical protein